MMTQNNSKEITLSDKEMIKNNEGETTRTGVRYSPVVDIYETDEAITLLADLPGVEKDKLDIHVEDKNLTITGLVDEPESRLQSLYTEYGIGGYTRSFRLGNAIDRSKISAVLKDGVLTLVLPKAAALLPRKIDVSVA